MITLRVAPCMNTNNEYDDASCSSVYEYIIQSTLGFTNIFAFRHNFEKATKTYNPSLPEYGK